MTADGPEDRIADVVRVFRDAPTDEEAPDVLDLLEDDDEQVRASCLEALADCADEPSSFEPLVPSLTSLVTDPNPRVRQRARTVLTRLAETCAESDRSLPGLKGLLTHEATGVQRDALYAAKAVGGRRPEVLAERGRELTELLSHDDSEIRRTAALVLGEVAGVDPDLGADAAPALVERLEGDDALVGNAAVRALAAVSAERPQAVTDAVPTMLATLDDGAIDREPVIETLSNVADVAPRAVREATPALVDVATDPADGVAQSDQVTSAEMGRQNERRLRRESARADAVAALGSVAERDPDAVDPHAGALCSLLQADGREVREETLALLRTLGTERPETMARIVPALVDHVVEPPVPAERERAHQVLVEFGDAAPSAFARALEQQIDGLADALHHDDAEVRGGAAGLLSYVAERDPTAVSGVEETLLELLRDGDPVVRGNAALALGCCGSPDAREALAALDPDEPFVADAVEQALARLE